MKRHPRAFALASACALTLAACGSDSNPTKAADTTAAAARTTVAATTAAAAATTAAGAATTAASKALVADAALVTAAKAEKKVNLIALPDSWANYKGILESFGTKYGIEHPVDNPDASSADEITAIKTLKGQPNQPDSVDVGPAFALDGAKEGLFTKFKPSTWDEIPSVLKDPDGNWVGSYYGIIAIASNAKIVKNPPKSFADLLKPEYKGQVSLNGDPRKAGAAFAGVYAAALANGGSFDNIQPGVDFFKKLKDNGNLALKDVNENSVLSGETPIVIDWTYNFPGLLDKLKKAGVEMKVNVPTDGVYAGYYAQAVVAGSPHQNAGKLWIEHILSDEGALGYLAGGAIPARFEALSKAGKITADMKKNLPAPELVAKIAFANATQITKSKDIITAKWVDVAGS